MARGIDGTPVFRDEGDRWRYLERASTVLEEGGTRCYAFALMPNHVHLFLQTGPAPLATTMARIGTYHALHFNKRYERRGHLFQNRYKSVPVEEESYFLELIRYIHLNPVRAGLVRGLPELGDCPWTGHQALMGKGGVLRLETERILGRLAEETAEGRRRLLEYMGKGIPAPGGGSPDGGPGGPETEFEKAPGHGWPPGAGGWTVTDVVTVACRIVGVPVGDVASGRRGVLAAKARALAAHLAVDELGASKAEVALALGVSRPAVWNCLGPGRALASSLCLTLDGVTPGDVLRP